MFYTPSYSNPIYYPAYSPYARSLAHERALAQEQAHALAQRRALQKARRAQYLPDEDSSEDEYAYNLSPRDLRERQYAELKRRQAALENRRREEEAYRQRMEQLRRESQQRLRRTPSPETPVRSHSQSPPLNQLPKARSPSPRQTTRSPSPTTSPSPSRTPTPSTTTAPQLHYSEIHDEAATKIQTLYRRLCSLRLIKDLERQFDELKTSYSFPTTLDFQGPDQGSVISLTHPFSSRAPHTGLQQTPKLAYTPNNVSLHAYAESLNRLLIKLDGIESWGEDRVRKERKRVVRQIEAEANDVETYWKQVWVAYVSGDESEDTEMQVAEDTETTAIVSEQPIPQHTISSENESVPIPELVSQGDGCLDSDSDSEFYEVEDIATPEEDSITPVTIVTGSGPDEPLENPVDSVVLQLTKNVGSKDPIVGLGDDFEMV